MNNQNLALSYMLSDAKSHPTDSTVPSIIRNIERMTEKYQKFIDSEIREDQANQTEQAEKVRELRDVKAPKTRKN
jgi:hypothetical protein